MTQFPGSHPAPPISSVAKKVEIYTDGACRGNPGPGGWGALLLYGEDQKELYGAEPETTNNRMELTAAIEAISLLKRRCELIIYTDSQYVRKGITEWIQNWRQRNWKTAAKQPVKNADLWKTLDQQAAQHDIEWVWVKGHAGNIGNEKADQLANFAIDQLLR